MASLTQLKKRIKSVGNISKITKAMEMVSASKMRQAQMQALNSRVYSRKLDEIFARIGTITDTSLHPLLSWQTEVEQHALLIISTDRGLTGSLNANLFKAVEQFQQEKKADVYTIGRLAKENTIKSGYKLIAEFGEIGEQIEYSSVQPISDLLRREFIQGKYKTVSIAYMDFISTLSQVPRITQLMPVREANYVDNPEKLKKEYIFEPSAGDLLDSLLPYVVEIKIYQSLLEARASEHSARMVAMKNASDNAAELKDDLSLAFNRSRQANITNELADIVTATMSLS